MATLLIVAGFLLKTCGVEAQVYQQVQHLLPVQQTHPQPLPSALGQLLLDLVNIKLKWLSQQLGVQVSPPGYKFTSTLATSVAGYTNAPPPQVSAAPGGPTGHHMFSPQGPYHSANPPTFATNQVYSGATPIHQSGPPHPYAHVSPNHHQPEMTYGYQHQPYTHQQQPDISKLPAHFSQQWPSNYPGSSSFPQSPPPLSQPNTPTLQSVLLRPPNFPQPPSAAPQPSAPQTPIQQYSSPPQKPAQQFPSLPQSPGQQSQLMPIKQVPSIRPPTYLTLSRNITDTLMSSVGSGMPQVSSTIQSQLPPHFDSTPGTETTLQPLKSSVSLIPPTVGLLKPPASQMPSQAVSTTKPPTLPSIETTSSATKPPKPPTSQTPSSTQNPQPPASQTSSTIQSSKPPSTVGSPKPLASQNISTAQQPKPPSQSTSETAPTVLSPNLAVAQPTPPLSPPPLNSSLPTPKPATLPTPGPTLELNNFLSMTPPPPLTDLDAYRR